MQEHMIPLEYFENTTFKDKAVIDGNELNFGETKPAGLSSAGNAAYAKQSIKHRAIVSPQ